MIGSIKKFIKNNWKFLTILITISSICVVYLILKQTTNINIQQEFTINNGKFFSKNCTDTTTNNDDPNITSTTVVMVTTIDSSSNVTTTTTDDPIFTPI